MTASVRIILSALERRYLREALEAEDYQAAFYGEELRPELYRALASLRQIPQEAQGETWHVLAAQDLYAMEERVFWHYEPHAGRPELAQFLRGFSARLQEVEGVS